MKHGCDNCKYRFFPVTRSPCDNCAMSGDKYSEWTAQTNADRIRSMTDEALAEFLGRTKAYGCIDRDRTSEFVEWFRKWLKEEVKE